MALHRRARIHQKGKNLKKKTKKFRVGQASKVQATQIIMLWTSFFVFFKVIFLNRIIMERRDRQTRNLLIMFWGREAVVAGTDLCAVFG